MARCSCERGGVQHPRKGSTSARSWIGGYVVRVREYFFGESIDGANWSEAGWTHRIAPGGNRHRAGIEYDRDADLRRRAGSPGGAFRSDLGGHGDHARLWENFSFAADLCDRESGV